MRALTYVWFLYFVQNLGWQERLWGQIRPEADSLCSWQKRMITLLASPAFFGRGYVQEGMWKAARAVADSLAAWGLKRPPFASDYLQTFSVAVHTFPDTVELWWGKVRLIPGLDFHVQPESQSLKGRFRLRPIRAHRGLPRLRKGRDAVFLDYLNAPDDSWRKQLAHLQDSVVKAGWPVVRLAAKQEAWYPARASQPSFVATIHPRAAHKVVKIPRFLTVHVRAETHSEVPCANSLAYWPGQVPDTFIVITAHLDHLGMLGREALYGGAHDNASGTAMMMALARYVASQPPPHYSLLFIGFGAEEIGLEGSWQFIHKYRPVLPRIRFLLNLDLMGGAEKGVTLVNGRELPHLSALIDSLNRTYNLLEKVDLRSNAPNSDHYFFTQLQVPAIFLYANGEGIAYHDVLDTAERLPWQNCPRLYSLLVNFLESLQKPLPSYYFEAKSQK
ncbi:MAG: M28 family peptidase [Flavobacteriales bacterium]|nr:M28 family peptidase [Flavobacteriales bacterium]